MGDVGDITTNFGYAEGGREGGLIACQATKSRSRQLWEGGEGNLMGWSMEGGKVVQGWVDEWTAIIMAYSFSPVKINGAIYGVLAVKVAALPQELLPSEVVRWGLDSEGM